ncbi:MAG: S-layer homology domain-containing protein [Butyricicoccaceae bacterium]
MPYHFVRRAGVLALAATMVVPQAGALSDVSSWAQEDIAAAQQAGLMPTSLADSSAREEITRAEFCAIAVKAYKQLTGKAVHASGQKFFRDTDDANVNAAYSLGLVTGLRQRLFRPEREHRASGSVRHSQQHPRQGAGIDAPEIAGDACVEDYDDVSTIKSYAVDPVVRMVDYTIVNGISDGLGSAQLAPSGTATREQAVIMANRFCSEFEKLAEQVRGRYHQAEHDGQHAEQPLEHPEHDHSGR